MNTDLLRTFIEVSRTRHFGQAAENLFLTQSAVSSRIKQLESVVGVNVFTRTKNNILLTSAGERLLPHAENLMAAWQIAIQEVGIPKKQNTQLALGGTSNLWDTFLQSVLPKLSRQFDHLHIRTEVNNPQHLVRSLLGGRLDVFAAFDPPSNKDIDSRCIGSIELIMVCNAAATTIEDIPVVGHVFVDWGTSVNLQQARLFREPIAPILHTGQSHIALEFILAHKGVAYLPRAIVEPYLNKGLLHQVEESLEGFQDVFLVYKKDADKTLPLEPIITFLEKMDIKPGGALQDLELE